MIGVFKQDDEGHWYFIPVELSYEFNKISDEIEGYEYVEKESEYDKFNRTFDQFRCDNPSSYLVIVVNEDLYRNFYS